MADSKDPNKQSEAKAVDKVTDKAADGKQLIDNKRIEKKVEIKDFKDKDKDKDKEIFKDQKDHKETKDHKEQKDHKETKDHKEQKDHKESKDHKHEFKEHKQEAKEFKIEGKELENKLEIKEGIKDIRDKIVPENPKDLVEGGGSPIDPSDPVFSPGLEQRIANLEGQMSTFISSQNRPDLGSGALKNEPDQPGE